VPWGPACWNERLRRPSWRTWHLRGDPLLAPAASATCALSGSVECSHRCASNTRTKASLAVIRGPQGVNGYDTMNDRRRGALIGLAVGDALGAAVEFRRPGSFAPVTGYRNGGPHGLEAGEWTDDTSMALALADSIASVGWDVNDQAGRYVQWWQTGKYSVNGRCFDIGITTRSALGNYVATKNARASGDRSDRASGNGSIMRLAPVPIRFGPLYPGRLDELSRLAEESSLPTHASEQCVSACRYLATLLAALIQGEDRDEVLSPDWNPLKQLDRLQPLHPLIQEVAQGSFRQKQPPAIQGSGWVVKSLEASLWAFHDADAFEEAVLRAVNLGDDADTTGAICGQLAGAYWGESQIPASLRSGLARIDMLENALAGILGA
jgi:ADP-ribosyl-[dinitrogen reductase] hydrolase